jgi:tetratricopeptide (TPR) repeat protein
VIAIALALTAFWQGRIARENEQRALRNFDAARDAVDKIGLTVAKDLRSIVGMPQDIIRTMLLQAQSIIDKLMADDAEGKALMRSRASLLNEFAKTYWFICDTDRALNAANDCIQVAGQLLEAAPKDLELANLVYDANLSFGDVVQVKGDAQGALNAFRRGQAALEPILDDPKSGEEAWRRLAWVIDRTGDIFRREGRFKEAGDKFTEAEAIRLRFLKYNPDSELWLTDLSWGHNRIGDNARENDDLRSRLLLAVQNGFLMVSDQQQKWIRALSSYRAALTIRRGLADKFPSDSVRQRNLAWSLNLVGLALLATGHPSDALASHKEARDVLQKLLANDARNTQWLRDLAITQNHLGDAQLASAELDAAVAEYRRAIHLREQLGSIDPKNARWIGEIALDRDRLAEACGAIKRSAC